MARTLRRSSHTRTLLPALRRKSSIWRPRRVGYDDLFSPSTSILRKLVTVAAILGLNLFLSSMQDSALDTGIRRELRVQAGRYFPLQALLSTTTLQQESERLINPDNPSHPNEAYLSIDAEPVLPVIKNEARLRKTKRTPTEVKTGIHSQKSLDASERASDPDQQVDISRDPSMTTLV